MSGGSFDYKYADIENLYKGEFNDPVLDLLLSDFFKVLHDLEWWQSEDYSEEQYRKSVDEFKKKWLACYSTENEATMRETLAYIKTHYILLEKGPRDNPKELLIGRVFSSDMSEVMKNENQCDNSIQE